MTAATTAVAKPAVASSSWLGWGSGSAPVAGKDAKGHAKGATPAASKQWRVTTLATSAISATGSAMSSSWGHVKSTPSYVAKAMGKVDRRAMCEVAVVGLTAAAAYTAAVSSQKECTLF